jgi:MerR family mercuric resistance operon transcriptional regulator
MPNTLTIAKLAAAGGVHLETVRYYQRRGLLREPKRVLGAVRRYDDGDVERLRFIKRSQLTGFTLAEIQQLLVLRENRSCRDTHALATRKLALVEERLRELTRLRRELKQWLASCERNRENAPCPVATRLARSEGESCC